jgi:hypothetical protein
MEITAEEQAMFRSVTQQRVVKADIEEFIYVL